MGPGRLRHAQRFAAATALAIASFFTNPLNPLTERYAYAQTPNHTNAPRTCSRDYPSVQDPLAMSPEMERLAQIIERGSTDPYERVSKLYAVLRSMRPRGDDSIARLPLSAAVAFHRREGRCGEFTSIVTAYLMRWNMPGGALIINLDGTQLRHFAPYIRVGDQEILIDQLLAEDGPRRFPGAIPETFSGRDYNHVRVIDSVRYEEVPFVYHYEAGRYFMRCPGLEPLARRAFREAGNTFRQTLALRESGYRPASRRRRRR